MNPELEPELYGCDEHETAFSSPILELPLILSIPHTHTVPLHSWKPRPNRAILTLCDTAQDNAAKQSLAYDLKESYNEV
ncbi:hypothetical protein HAV15_008893 [Penicillium sp. str. |uniref:Str. FM013 n=1 Tax=Penicillium camemberti (strain FM 013) TaxID=1429867 RepID=A0A0G4PVI3_PENC3|nr:hypothetical protein HAV15_008893 [Penicillium sp. str. \